MDVESDWRARVAAAKKESRIRNPETNPHRQKGFKTGAVIWLGASPWARAGEALNQDNCSMGPSQEWTAGKTRRVAFNGEAGRLLAFGMKRNARPASKKVPTVRKALTVAIRAGDGRR